MKYLSYMFKNNMIVKAIKCIIIGIIGVFFMILGLMSIENIFFLIIGILIAAYGFVVLPRIRYSIDTRIHGAYCHDLPDNMVEFGFKDYSYKFEIKELPQIKILPETDSNGKVVPKDIKEKILVRLKGYKPKVRKTDGKKIIWIKDSTTLQFVDADETQKARVIKEDKNNNLRKKFIYIPIVLFVICLLFCVYMLFETKQINMKEILLMIEVTCVITIAGCIPYLVAVISDKINTNNSMNKEVSFAKCRITLKYPREYIISKSIETEYASYKETYGTKYYAKIGDADNQYLYDDEIEITESLYNKASEESLYVLVRIKSKNKVEYRIVEEDIIGY